MRAIEDVVKRCVCVEIVCQRLALEQQVDEVEDAESVRAGLVTSAEKLDVMDAMFEAEVAILNAPLGSLDLEDEDFSVFFADAAVLLWCLKRIDTLPASSALETEALNDVLAAGFWSVGGKEILQTMATAELRDQAELKHMLSIVAKAVKDRDKRGPPFTVLYVIPWILSAAHPWGKAIELALVLPN